MLKTILSLICLVPFQVVYTEVLYDQDLIEVLPMPKLKRNLILIKEDCGEVCDTTDKFVKQPGQYFDKITKDINCDYLFESPLIDGGFTDISEQQLENNNKPEAPTFHNVPKEILDLYTFDGRIPLESSYLNDVHWVPERKPENDEKITLWNKELIDEFRGFHKKGVLRGGYSTEIVNNMTRLIKEHMQDQVLFIRPAIFSPPARSGFD